jgi:hypothetical protein
MCTTAGTFAPLLFFSSSSSVNEAGCTEFQTQYISQNLVAPGIEPGTSRTVARNSDLDNRGRPSIFYLWQIEMKLWGFSESGFAKYMYVSPTLKPCGCTVQKKSNKWDS